MIDLDRSSGPPASVRERVISAAPISLAEMQASAALHTRVDRKYVITWDVLLTVLDALAATHRALEIDGRRIFGYETIYFDSASLGAYRAHLQRRRRRYKVRSRRYVDSDLHFFEVKLKGTRGETVKHQLPYTAEDHGDVTPEARAFLAERLADHYPRMTIPDLSPSVHTHYQRITFVNGAERLTCDFDLTFADGTTQYRGLEAGYVIVESKCEHGLGGADRELRRLGIRPITCSKYCVGVGLMREDVKVNELRWLLSRYFHWDPRPPRRNETLASADA